MFFSTNSYGISTIWQSNSNYMFCYVEMQRRLVVIITSEEYTCMFFKIIWYILVYFRTTPALAKGPANKKIDFILPSHKDAHIGKPTIMIL